MPAPKVSISSFGVTLTAPILGPGAKTTSATAMKKKHDSEHSAEWRNWYVLVLAVLLAQILFFTWFTAYFS